MFYFSPRTPHPSFISILKSFFFQCQIDWKKKDFILIKIFKILIRTSLVFEYLLLHFYTYTFVGKWVIRICCIFCFNISANSSKLVVFICFVNLVFFISTIVLFFIKMQIYPIRQMLIDVIGLPVFNSYVGSNPGVAGASRSAGVLIGGLVLSFGFKVGAGKADVIHKNGICDSYRKNCEVTNTPVNPEFIEKIYSEPQVSVLQFLTGYTDKNPVAFGSSRLLKDLIDKMDD